MYIQYSVDLRGASVDSSWEGERARRCIFSFFFFFSQAGLVFVTGLLNCCTLDAALRRCASSAEN
jgi:hypothetical protein